MKNRAILIAVALILSSGLAAAQDGDKKPTAPKGPKPITYQNWDVLCEKDDSGARICQMFQNIGLNVSKDVTLRMQVKIGYIPGQKDPILLLTLPLGVALPPGAQVQVDSGSPLKLQFELCDPVGCRAGIPAKPSLLAALKKGKEAKVSFAIQRQAGSVPVSLDGFTKALNHIKPK